MGTFLKLAHQLWKAKIKFNVKPMQDVVFLHYNPDVIANPEAVIIQIKKQFCDTYKLLHGVDPLVIVLPVGYSMSMLNMKEFLSVLPTDTRNRLQTELFKYRNIEVVSEADVNKIIGAK